MTRLTAVAATLALGITISACGGGDQGAGQQAQTTTKQSQSTGPRIDVSDSELKSFVEASMQLEAFRSEMQQRMSEAQNQKEGRKVRQRLMQERDSIIQAAGLDGTKRYNAIMKAIKSSEQLRKRYTSLRDQMESDTAGSSDTTSG
ncbi:MAG: DUF4168 domain-containing protein [Gemmatimonadota bacterium]